jgi:hypothetical protein
MAFQRNYLGAPAPQLRAPLFVGDLFTGDNNLTRNVISLPRMSASEYIAQRYPEHGVSFPPPCLNSSFSNALNQNQYNSKADVVLMQTDSGGVVPIDNAMNIENTCKRNYMPQMPQDMWSVANAPVLTSVSKQNYMQNLANEHNRQSIARAIENNGGPAIVNPSFGTLQNNYLNNQYAPALMSVTKENYLQNLANEYNKQSFARSAENDGLAMAMAQGPIYKLQERYWKASSLDNPYQPVWRAVDSKYLN